MPRVVGRRNDSSTKSQFPEFGSNSWYMVVGLSAHVMHIDIFVLTYDHKPFYILVI